MAKSTAAPAAGGETAERSSGLLGFIIAMLVATVVAGVGGGIFGMYGIGTAGGVPEKSPEKHTDKPKSNFAGNMNLKALSPIITNLAAPRGTWIRLEAAIVLDAASKEENVLAGKIAEDIVAFLRTIPLAQIEGANGFQHLREDLNDRARMRSGGSVRELIIQSMIVE